MNVFTPYKNPIECGKCLDKKRLNNQINEANIILDAINGKKAWANHPCTLQYKEYSEWLEYYRLCLFWCLGGNYRLAEDYNALACKITPPFLTDEFCYNMQRRLYTKLPQHYEQYFGKLEPTQENWYFVNGELRKYINGKQIKK